MSKSSVLVIDDEKDLIELVRYNLEREGFEVIAANDGPAGLDIATRHKPDLIVLDLMMPAMDGLEVCRRLRAGSATAQVPLIMLTAKAAESDRVVGLEIGADDYVTKPFSPRELVARVRAVLRRAAAREQHPPAIRRGELTVDLGRREAAFRGRPIALTATEFRLLWFLASRPGRAVSRQDILDAVSDGQSTALDRTVDGHVTALRRKIGEPGLIQTVRGFGYRFRD